MRPLQTRLFIVLFLSVLGISLFAQHEDCVGAIPICDNQVYNLNNNGAGIDDFSPANNNQGCLLQNEHQAAWFIIKIDASSPINGVLEFTLNPESGFTGDYDFALYGPVSSCENLSYPIRCSYAGDNPTCTYCPQTGMGNAETDLSEGADGNAFVSSLEVAPQEIYYLLIDNFQADASGFSIDWTGTAILDCNQDCYVQAGSYELPLQPGNQTTHYPVTTPDYDHYYLCEGDDVEIFSQQNYLLPQPETGEASTLMWAIYDALPPSFPSPSDPAFTGVLIDQDSLWDTNVLASGSLHTAQSFWIIPVTADDASVGPNGTLGIDTNNDDCYAYGKPIRLSYLDEINYTVSYTCDYPLLSATGGLPAFNGSSFALTDLQPAHALANTYNPQDNQDFFISNLAVGEAFSFTLSDTTGCHIAISGTYDYAGDIPEAIVGVDGQTCTGDDLNLLGAANISGSSIIYNWVGPNAFFSDKQNPVVSPAYGGTYSLVVIVDGCTSDATNIDVVVEAQPVLDPIPAQINCDESFDLASIVITGSNLSGTGINYYNDVNGLPGDIINSLVTNSGIYWVEVYAGIPPASCGVFESVEVSIADIVLDINQVSALNCADVSDGYININYSGGTAPYNFLWSNMANTPDIQNLSPGMYSLMVTDARGCTADLNAEVTSPDPLVVWPMSLVNPSCFGAEDGSMRVNANGGSPPYIFSWSDGGVGDVTTGLGFGNYSVTVYDSKGCTASIDGLILTQPNEIIASYTSTTSTCGLFNGSLSVTASGGAGSLTYLWSHDPTHSGSETAALAEGAYTVTISDWRGCDLVLPMSVSHELGPEITIENIVHEQCYQDNASITVSYTGGSGLVNLEWSHDAALQDLTATGLSNGIYFVSVTDGNGCVDVQEIQIENTGGPQVELLAVQAASCEMALDGGAELSITGGTPPYDFHWSHNSALASNILSDVPAGIYVIEVADDEGCFKIFTFEIPHTSTQSLEIDNLTPATCGDQDGSVSVIFIDGVAPISYEWIGAANGDSPHLNNVGSGQYTVIATDASSCEAMLDIYIPNVDGPMAQTTITHPSGCIAEDGSIVLDPMGGTPPYIYSWSHDINLFQPQATNLASGNYSVTIEDVNACKNIISTELIYDNPNPPLLDTLSVTHTGCMDSVGAIFMTTMDGIAPYTYEWFNDSTQSFVELLPKGDYGVTVTDASGCTASLTTEIEDFEEIDIIEFTLEVEPSCGLDNGLVAINLPNGLEAYWVGYDNWEGLTTISDLPAGTYTVGATSPDDICVMEKDITLVAAPAPSLTIDSLAHFGCQGPGYIRLVLNSTAANGASFAWSHDPSLDGPIAINLSGGIYNVTVVDGNNCELFQSITIEENTVAPIINVVITQDPSCGVDNGTIEINATGGFGILSYTWSHNPLLDLPAVSDLTAGSYTVSVTDEALCIATMDFTLTSGMALDLQVDQLVNSSCGSSVGEITLVTTGGPMPHIYNWSHDASNDTNTASGLAAGNYQITVTDQTGCTAEISVAIEDTNGPALILNEAVDPVCEVLGRIRLTANGGTPPLVYTWLHDASLSTGTAENLVGGSYTLTVMDANGCQASETIDLAPSPVPDLNIDILVPASCGQDNGAVFVNVTDVLDPIIYSWSHDASITVPFLQDMAAGDYSLEATNANGCTGNILITIPASDGPIVTIDQLQGINCNQAVGEITLAVANGVDPITYNWSHDATLSGPSATGLSDENYFVTVTDGNSCSSVFHAHLPTDQGPVIIVDSITPNICYTNNAAIFLSTAPKAAYRINCGSTTDNTKGPDASLFAADQYYSSGNQATYFAQITSNNKKAKRAFYGNRRWSQEHIDYTFPLVNGDYIVNLYFIDVDNNPQPTRSFDILLEGTVVEQDFDIWASYGSRVGAKKSYNVNVLDSDLNLSLVTKSQMAQIAGIEIISVNQPTVDYAWSNNPSLNTSSQENLYNGFFRTTVTDENGCTEDLSLIIGAIDSISELSNVIVERDSCARGTGSIRFDNNVSALWRLNCASDEDYTDSKGKTFMADFILGGVKSFTNTGISNTQDDFLYQSARGGSFNYSLPVPNGCYEIVLHLSDNNATVDPVQSMNVDLENYNVLHDINVYNTISANFTAYTDTVQVTVSDQQLNINCYAIANYSTLSAFEVIPCLGIDFQHEYSWSHDPSFKEATATNLAAGNYELTVTNQFNCQSIFPFQVEDSDPIRLLDVLVSESHCGQADAQIEVEALFGNMVVNGDFESGSFGFTTDLSPGRWEVGDSPLDIWNGFLDCKDHTSGSGNMLLATPNEIANIWCQDFAVEQGQEYVAEGYAMLINDALNGFPQIEITVNGFGVSDTLIVNESCEWEKISARFFAPAMQIQLCFKDLVAADGPNDLALDDLALFPTENILFDWSHDAALTTSAAHNVAAGVYDITLVDDFGCELDTAVTVMEAANPDLSIQDLVKADCIDANGKIELAGRNIYRINCGGGMYSSPLTGNVFEADNYGSFGVSQTIDQDIMATEDDPIYQSYVQGNFKYNLPISDTLVDVYLHFVEPDNADRKFHLIAEGSNVLSQFSIYDETSSFNNKTVTKHQVSVTDGSLDISVFQVSGNPLLCAIEIYASNLESSYSWSHDGANTSLVAADLTNGIYDISVMDIYGCQETLNVNLPAPDGPVLSLTAMQNATACMGIFGYAEVGVMASSEVSYSWSHNINLDTSFVSDLERGSYTVSVTDAFGCTDLMDIEITDSTIPEIQILASQQPDCDTATGQIEILASGGVGSFDYSWSHDLTLDTSVVYDLLAGIYLVTVTDKNGCAAVETITLDAQGPELELINLEPTTCNEMVGSIEVNDIGNGQGLTSYHWAHDLLNNSNTSSLLGGGSYTVVAQDEAGCTDTLTAIIPNDDGPIVEAVMLEHLLDCDQNSGQATIVNSGGVGVITYHWSHDASLQDSIATALPAGDYTVELKDENGCSNLAHFEILAPSPINVALGSRVDPRCGEANGAIQVYASGGAGPYVFTWSHDMSIDSDSISGLSAGVYDLIVSDARNCQTAMTINLTDLTGVDILSVDSISSQCGSPTGSLVINTNLDSDSLSFMWAHDLTLNTDSLSMLLPGDYHLLVTDSLGCQDSVSIEIISEGLTLEAYGEEIICDDTEFVYQGLIYQMDTLVVDSLIASTGCDSIFQMDIVFAESISLTTEAWTCELDEVGIYYDTLQTSIGCDSILITEVKNILEDGYIDIEDQETSLYNSVDLEVYTNLDIENISWSPDEYLSCDECLDPTVNVDQTTVFTIEIVDANGCLMTQEVTVTVTNEIDVYIPNAFSPNGDGNNEIFMVFSGKDVDQVNRFEIMDRWGSRLFLQEDFPSNDPDYGWDGRFKGQMLKPQVCSYRVEVQYQDGTYKVFTGYVTITR